MEQQHQGFGDCSRLEPANDSQTDSSHLQLSAQVEDITDRLNQMNVDMPNSGGHQYQQYHQQQQEQQHHLSQSPLANDGPTLNCEIQFAPPKNQQQQNQQDHCDQDQLMDTSSEYNNYQPVVHGSQTGMPDNESPLSDIFQLQQQQQEQLQQLLQEQQLHDIHLSRQQQQRQNLSNILIVTNVDSSVFTDKLMQAEFEALFKPFDLTGIIFRYLKSFRRVRLDFTSAQSAEMARINVNQYRLGNTEFKCYSAQIIKPDSGGGEQDGDNQQQNSENNSTNSSTYLNIPKLTKQFLISPPASPPVGWEPVDEASPCIDVQLISAIANLVPGKTHEIHAGNDSQPGIFVEVCEDAQFHHHLEKAGVRRTCSPTSRIIPRTMSPAGFGQQTQQ